MHQSLEILDERLRARVAFNIRYRRRALTLSVVAAAKLAGVTIHVWYRIERGKFNSDLFRLAKIAIALEIDPRDLLNPVPPSAEATAASVTGAESVQTGKEGA